MKLRLTNKSFSFLVEKGGFNRIISVRMNKLKITNDGIFYYLEYEDDVRTVSLLLMYVRLLYTKLPDERDVWINGLSEYSLNDSEALHIILLPFENKTGYQYPLSEKRLNDIIKKNGIDTLEKAKDLVKGDTVFLILPFSGSDIDSLSFQMGYEDQKDNTIYFDHTELNINNRYIIKNFEFTGGSISFENCIIEGDITVSCADSLVLSQCIILGKVWITSTQSVYLNFANIEHILMYNCVLNKLNIEYSKIYRFVFHSSSVKRISIFKNLFVEPYISAIDFPQGTKLSMDQFVVRNINHNMIKKINRTKRPSIIDKDTFFLTFTFDKPDSNKPDSPKPLDSISYDMAKIFLNYGELHYNHDLYANMRYELTYNSNHGWRRLLVIITGAFYKPLRWGLYLLFNTLLFSLLYVFVPTITFTNTLTQSKESINIWISLYYSICQILGTNPTIYSPFGLSQILTTIQTLANTAFIANFAVSFTNKYFRDDLSK